MRITFEDNSFLEFNPQENGSMRIILCGIRGYKQATMSTADITSEQVTELFLFLNKLETEKRTKPT